MKSTIAFIVRTVLYYFFRIFPVNSKKIFFQNFNGKGYGDNPKYIVEEILRRGLDVTLVWSVAREHSGNIPEKIRTVPYKSIKAIYEEVTSKIWIDNCRKQLYIKKRKGQYYIQTWHGTVNLKKIEGDVEHKLSEYYVKQAKKDSCLADLFLSDSTFSSRLYRTSFWYAGEIYETGSPREDILINYNPDIKSKVRDSFNLSSDIKILLYAPTFRDNSGIEAYNINFEQILSEIQKQTKEQWVFMIRLHPNISKISDFMAYSKYILNASYYDDMQELLIVADILITDYSDCMYEFAIMHKPVFLYASDYEAYIKERDFYFDLFSLPFPCAVNNEELLRNMKQFNVNQYINNIDAFFQNVGLITEGNASKKTVDRIVEIINSND